MDEYEFAVREEKTYEVIEDVKTFRSEIGILYLNDFNRKVLTKLSMSRIWNSARLWTAGFMYISGKAIR